MTGNSLTQDQLKSLLSYNDETGEFTRVKAVGHNGNWKAGRKVGYLDKSNGYIKISLLGKKYYAHRLAWLYVHGYLPKEQIDHIDHDKMNNAIVNLREASDQVNRMNQPPSKANTTGFCGVGYIESSGKYRARIMKNGKQLHVGCYDSAESANTAVEVARKELGFHENHGKELKV